MQTIAEKLAEKENILSKKQNPTNQSKRWRLAINLLNKRKRKLSMRGKWRQRRELLSNRKGMMPTISGV